MSKFKGGPRSTDKSVETLIAEGYFRTSNAYGLVTRIDRDDWIDVLAADRPGTCRADYLIKSGPDAGKPSPQWADFYRRVYSADDHTVLESEIGLFPSSS
jgi:hypothetical protein